MKKLKLLSVMVKLTEDERRQLERLAEKRGMAMSVIIRLLVKEAAEKDGLA